jgi:predicted nucleic acid-binding protein
MSDATSPPSQPVDALASGTPAVVLDSNVVLDWLLFRDPGCAVLARQLEAGHLHWYATAPMRRELAIVLGRPALSARVANCEHILSLFDLHARIVAEPLGDAGSAGRLRCRDPDDQKFIDLALALRARWLFSKDRAVLALAGVARLLGVEVLTPAQWQRRTATATDA